MAALVEDDVLIALVFLILKDGDFGRVCAVGGEEEDALHDLLNLDLRGADVFEMFRIQVTCLR